MLLFDHTHGLRVHALYLRLRGVVNNGAEQFSIIDACNNLVPRLMLRQNDHRKGIKILPGHNSHSLENLLPGS